MILQDPEVSEDKLARCWLTVQKFPVVNFETINSEEINMTKTDLSKDQQYLINIYWTVKTEESKPDFAMQDLGPFWNSEWLTCATRILRLYISEVKHCDEIKLCAVYILKIYAPIWFGIKMHPSVKFGKAHMFNLAQKTSQLSERVR